ncbi:hypothetical protein PoB_004992200 [Plakobranchus ocellatus]|uniref:Uncharacterized protein n=1 Tax=Plakobranchus ocellatus TaxID=259542 RepID=A0AAV4BWI8_9GAST|nr:hypothetical protein PoB_004992200 [Plakobranchus ocellatus]
MASWKTYKTAECQFIKIVLRPLVVATSSLLNSSHSRHFGFIVARFTQVHASWMRHKRATDITSGCDTQGIAPTSRLVESRSRLGMISHQETRVFPNMLAAVKVGLRYGFSSI